jgi:DNA-binding Lrp family transcriptional regulator
MGWLDNVKELFVEGKEFPYAFYILVKVIPGFESEIFQELEKIEEISECYKTFGDYDFVVIIRLEPNAENLSQVLSIAYEIEELNGVVISNPISATTF